MSFLTAPPEINSLMMFTGPGSSPLLEAATAWEGLASELGSAADSFSSLISGLAGQAWQGPASAAMAAAAAPYASWLSAASAHASGTATSAQAVAGAFESALAATVHPTLVSVNRSNFVQAVRSNLFGQNAPAIAAFESQYEAMWAQDVSAMVGYHGGASAAASNLANLPQLLRSLPKPSSLPPTPAPSTSGWATSAPTTMGAATPAPITSVTATWASTTWAAGTPAPTMRGTETSACITTASATSVTTTSVSVTEAR